MKCFKNQHEKIGSKEFWIRYLVKKTISTQLYIQINGEKFPPLQIFKEKKNEDLFKNLSTIELLKLKK